LQVGANAIASTNTIDIAPVLADCQSSTLGVTISITGANWSSAIGMDIDYSEQGTR